MPSMSGRDSTELIGPLKRKHTEDLSSRKTSSSSTSTTPTTPKPTKWVSTSSPSSLQRSLPLDSLPPCLWSDILKETTTTKSLVPLTGPPKEKFPQSRTKAAADHAGLSQLPVSLNPSSSSRDKVLAFQSNNLWTAPELKETKAATVDGHPMLSSMPLNMDGLLRLNIVMLEKTKLARRTEVTFALQGKRASQDATDLAVESTLPPSQ